MTKLRKPRTERIRYVTAIRYSRENEGEHEAILDINIRTQVRLSRWQRETIYGRNCPVVNTEEEAIAKGREFLSGWPRGLCELALMNLVRDWQLDYRGQWVECEDTELVCHV